MVARAKEYIAAGDIFQVVLSQRFEAPFALPPFSLYRALRRVNPAPFLFFLDFGGFAVAGSSPEILVRVRDGNVTIRPIAGTRPRGDDPARGQGARRRAARRSEGARRAPDAARSRPQRCRPRRRDRHREGHRPVLHRALQPRHAHRLERRGQALGDNTTRIDALAAGFPAGTVSGAPKVRAMEIIDELEKEKRGLYAGSVGYFSGDRRDGHLHRAAHRAGEGRRDVCAGRRRHRRRFEPGVRAAGDASTRPRRCSAPPRRRAASRAPQSAGSSPIIFRGVFSIY